MSYARYILESYFREEEEGSKITWYKEEGIPVEQKDMFSDKMLQFRVYGVHADGGLIDIPKKEYYRRERARKEAEKPEPEKVIDDGTRQGDLFK